MVRRSLVVALVVAGFLVPQTAGATTVERHHCREECDGGGDGNGNSGGEYEGGKSGDTDQRGDHNCRNFCFYGIPAPGQGGQQPQSVACLVPVPWHCDEKPSGRPAIFNRSDAGPAGFLPPDPRKIPQQVADFVKLVGDFVQGVVRFAV